MGDGAVRWTREDEGDLTSSLGCWWHGNGVPTFEATEDNFTEGELREILRGLELFRAAPEGGKEEGS